MYTREDATEGSTLLEKYEAAKKINPSWVFKQSSPINNLHENVSKKSIRSGADQYF